MLMSLFNYFYLSQLIFATADLGQVRPLGEACIAKHTPYYSSSNTRLKTIDEKLLISHEFRVFSYIFPQLPANGYPITFEEGGRMGTGQHEGDGWRIQNNELHVLNQNGNVTSRYRFHSRCNSLASEVRIGDSTILMEIAIISENSEDRRSGGH